MGSGIKRKSGKTPPYLSHEFVIKNHGDIVTCIVMVFIVGMMFQVTYPLASSFVVPKYNITEPEPAKSISSVLYTYGLKDIPLVLFYSLGAIILHAVIQEYVLDKASRKARLSKTNTSKYNESGQMIAFYLISIAWAANIFVDEGYFRSLSFFWTDYPHVGMAFWTKMYFVFQMSYWLHLLPELYFQKTKKEEMTEKVVYSVSNFAICSSIYLLNFTRVGLVLLTVHHLCEFLFHMSRFIRFNTKSKVAKYSLTVYNFVFVVGRLVSSALGTYVFLFGLKETSVDLISIESGNFNTPMTRYTCLFVVLTIQLMLLLNFVSFKFRNSNDNVKSSASTINTRSKTKKSNTASSPETSDLDSQTEENLNATPKATSVRSKAD